MIDYPALAALYAIIETQGFETAAARLCITQSAISQRIKALERYYGEAVLIRKQPYQPTELGQNLLNHYKRMKMLEEDLQTQLAISNQPPRISIAISRDSLETWFIAILAKLKNIMPVTLEIIADDQEITLDYLKKGLVSACASTYSKPISGCKVDLLGYFDYVLVASPEFKKYHFHNKRPNKKNLTQAPFLMFDKQDHLHTRYLKHHFNIATHELRQHIIPSVAGFRQFALHGYAYALIPEIDIISELHNEKLINLFPDKVWRMPVYWHSWAIETATYKKLNTLVKEQASKVLKQD